MWTDNPVADAEAYYNECEERIANRPVCSCCDYPIQDETYYRIGNDIYCNRCMEGFKEWVDD